MQHQSYSHAHTHESRHHNTPHHDYNSMHATPAHMQEVRYAHIVVEIMSDDRGGIHSGVGHTGVEHAVQGTECKAYGTGKGGSVPRHSVVRVLLGTRELLGVEGRMLHRRLRVHVPVIVVPPSQTGTTDRDRGLDAVVQHTPVNETATSGRNGR